MGLVGKSERAHRKAIEIAKNKGCIVSFDVNVRANLWNSINDCISKINEFLPYADIVKVSYTGDIDSFRDVVRGALAPVVIAGGPKMNTDMDVLNMVHDSIEAGGRGVSIGRNVFQNKNVEGITRAISKIVLEDYSVEEAAKFLKQ